VKKEQRFQKRESEAEGADLTRISEATSATEGSAERPSGVHENAVLFSRAAATAGPERPSR
jgi:hypothetical protein